MTEPDSESRDLHDRIKSIEKWIEYRGEPTAARSERIEGWQKWVMGASVGAGVVVGAIIKPVIEFIQSVAKSPPPH